MRHLQTIRLAGMLLILLPACTPVDFADTPLGGVNITISTSDPFTTGDSPTVTDPPSPSDNETDPPTTTEPSDDPNDQTVEPDPSTTEPDLSAYDGRFDKVQLTGSVFGEGNYELFELGTSFAGDEWKISQTTQNGRYTVVLLDEHFNMIRRGTLELGVNFKHTVREDADKVYVGVTPAYGSNGGAYTLEALVTEVKPVPDVAKQIVYLNYNAVNGVDVNYRTNLSHPAFDAAMLGSAYAGQTDKVKAIILEQMQRDYAAYNIEFYTSDDGPPPQGTFSTVHFGSEGQGLLGLADNVDQYNSDAVQDAVVFVNTFQIYSVMNLSTTEMSQMVANTASHELGHLLGLYHTHDPGEVMDTSANAWELTEDQLFQRAPLDEAVFPFGYEDTPTLLEQIVGLRPGGPLFEDAKLAAMMKSTDLAMREMFALEAPHRCGNCAHPE